MGQAIMQDIVTRGSEAIGAMNMLQNATITAESKLADKNNEVNKAVKKLANQIESNEKTEAILSGIAIGFTVVATIATCLGGGAQIMGEETLARFNINPRITAALKAVTNRAIECVEGGSYAAAGITSLVEAGFMVKKGSLEKQEEELESNSDTLSSTSQVLGGMAQKQASDAQTLANIITSALQKTLKAETSFRA